jgi:dihydroorotase
VLSATPARIGRITGQGSPIEVGAPAELVLYDTAATRPFGTVDLAGKGVNSPYLGLELPGRVIATFHRGYATVLDGAVLPSDQVAAAARRAARSAEVEH